MALSMTLALSVGVISAQGYYDDDLYYNASKAKKENKTTKKTETKTTTSDNQAVGMYYFDGTEYVPWNNVGIYNSADNYQYGRIGSDRDVDEYNRRTSPLQTTDSISLEDLENMTATYNLARFNNSQIARQAISENGDGTTTYDPYNDIYNEGYTSGYDAGYNSASNSNVTFSIGLGYPYNYYGYYDSWYWPYDSYYWPYNSWRYPYYYGYYPYSCWGWNPYYTNWGWGWGYTIPGYGWGGHYYGDFGHTHPGHFTTPSAGHRPRTGGGTNLGTINGSRGNYGGSSSNRPGYRPPVSASSISNGSTGKYGGSSSGRNSHFGISNTSGSRTSGTVTNHSGSSTTNHSGNFGASQSTRNSSNSSSSSRSGSYNSGGGFSGGGRSGGFGGGGGSHSGGGGGGGHRGR